MRKTLKGLHLWRKHVKFGSGWKAKLEQERVKHQIKFLHLFVKDAIDLNRPRDMMDKLYGSSCLGMLRFHSGNLQ